MLGSVLNTQGQQRRRRRVRGEDTLKEVAGAVAACSPLFDLEVARFKYPRGVRGVDELGAGAGARAVANRLLAIIKKSIGDFSWRCAAAS